MQVRGNFTTKYKPSYKTIFSVKSLQMLRKIKLNIHKLKNKVARTRFVQIISSWTRKRKIGVIVLILWLAIFLLVSYLPESFFLGAPSIHYYSDELGNTWQAPGCPGITYSQALSFSAIGSFSVNNPIDVTVHIFGVNMSASDFLSNYPTVIKPNSNLVLPLALEMNLTVDKAHSGWFVGKGTVVFSTEGTTWLIPLAKNQPIPTLNMSNFVGFPSAITITGVSDTLATHFDEATAKIAWQIGTFSIILLEPVLESILLKEKKPKEEPQ
jgi:hypothetical protein